MDKQIIRLTESDLHRIVKESVQKVLQEMKPDDFKNPFSPYFHSNKRSDKPISPKRNSVKKPIEEEMGPGSPGAGFAGGSATPVGSSNAQISSTAAYDVPAGITKKKDPTLTRPKGDIAMNKGEKPVGHKG